jgi:hypothetical protein
MVAIGMALRGFGVKLKSVAQNPGPVYVFWYFFEFCRKFATELQKLACFLKMQASPGEITAM